MTSARRSGSAVPEPRLAIERNAIGPAERVHPDAVAEQGAPTPATRRVDGEHGDLELVLAVQTDAADQLVGQARTCPSRRCR